MMERLNFEEIADEYSEEINSPNPNMSKISRCDWLIIEDDKILFIENTDLTKKDLLNPNKFSKEVIENVKKMWGSLSVFSWYFSKHQHLEKVSGKDRIFILFLEEENPKTIRMLGNLMKALRKYRNSSFSDVMYKIKKRREHER